VKTTIELPESLLREVKAIAAAEGGTIRSVIEEALRRDLERRQSATRWEPRPDLVVAGQGLTEEAAHLSWAEIRERAGRPIPSEGNGSTP